MFIVFHPIRHPKPQSGRHEGSQQCNLGSVRRIASPGNTLVHYPDLNDYAAPMELGKLLFMVCETIHVALLRSWGRNNVAQFFPCAPLPPHPKKRSWKLALRLLPFRVVLEDVSDVVESVPATITPKRSIWLYPA